VPECTDVKEDSWESGWCFESLPACYQYRSQDRYPPG